MIFSPVSLPRVLTLEGGLDGAVSLKILGFNVSAGWTVKAYRHELAHSLHVYNMCLMICTHDFQPWRLTGLALILGTLGLIIMKLAFIPGDLTLLFFGELKGLGYVRRRAYLIKHSTRVVKVGIDGSREIFVVGLCPRQPRHWLINIL